MKAASVEKAKKYKPKKQPLTKRLVRYWPLYVMLIPCIIYYALICYVPMAGSVLAMIPMIIIYIILHLRIIPLRKESGEAHGSV